jgi:hypothetical protein
MALALGDGSAPVVAETLAPLQTQSTQTLKAGEVEFGLAIAYRHDTTFPFTRASEQPERDELEIPRLNANFGLADRAEFQIAYTYLSIDENSPGVGKETGSGDARFFTKVRLIDQKGWRPDIGFRAGAKLPNADDKERLGTDETDVLLDVLFGRRDGRLMTAMNLGLSILGEPGTSEQDDVLTYGAATLFQIIDSVDLAAEIHGIAISNKNNDAASFLGAVRYHWKPVSLYLGASVGLTVRAEAFGIVGGITWSHQF